MSANTSAPNRASLLSGLRTGGVRSTSNIPHTAAPGVTSFHIPRVPSHLQSSVFPEEDDEQGQYAQNVFVNHGVNRALPMTAAVDGPNNRFMQQQQRDVNPNIGSFSPAFAGQPNHVQAQALQMQMMQLELLRMQTIQAQQYQAQFLAAQQPQSARRPNFNPPATAGPTGSFDLRSASLSAQMRRAQPQEELQVPMTAALGGKFGVRSGPMGRFSTEDYDDASVPPTPNSTTVISGGTSLGGATPTPTASVSKSESASNWRRGGNNNSVLRGANRPSLGGKTSPPPTERRLSPPPASSAPAPTSLGKSRPQPLSFNGAVSQPMPAVAIDSSEGENEDGYSTSSSESAASNSPPTTPRSSSSDRLSVSPPKDAGVPVNMKVMPAGLGLGHPISASPPKAVHRMASQPMRQPRGPPSGPDELGPRNFAARLVPRLTVSVA